jgi:hypothetical protein
MALLAHQYDVLHEPQVQSCVRSHMQLLLAFCVISNTDAANCCLLQTAGSVQDLNAFICLLGLTFDASSAWTKVVAFVDSQTLLFAKYIYDCQQSNTIESHNLFG